MGRRPITILISIDGLRADFDEFYDPSTAPNLVALSKQGIRARHVIPQFNTLTLPNHISIATGLYSENHGMVSNFMFDFEMDDCWTSWDFMSEANCHLNAEKALRWWKSGLRTAGAEPIWTAVEKSGGVSGVYAWPLYDLPFSGVMPQYISGSNCDNACRIPLSERIDTIVDWVTMPVKPADFVAIYIGELDNVEHKFGVKHPETVKTLSDVDAAIGRLIIQLQDRGVWPYVNLLITSDHGHVDIDVTKFAYLDDYVEKQFYARKDPSMWPIGCSVDFLYEKLSRIPHVKVYTKSELMASSRKSHFSKHWRIGPLVTVPDEHAFLMKSRFDSECEFPLRGMHGYDFDLPSMWPCFVASGPAFRRGLDFPPNEPLDQVDISALCYASLGIKSPPSDAQLSRVQHYLA